MIHYAEWRDNGLWVDWFDTGSFDFAAVWNPKTNRLIFEGNDDLFKKTFTDGKPSAETAILTIMRWQNSGY